MPSGLYRLFGFSGGAPDRNPCMPDGCAMSGPGPPYKEPAPRGSPTNRMGQRGPAALARRTSAMSRVPDRASAKAAYYGVIGGEIETKFKNPRQQRPSREPQERQSREVIHRGGQTPLGERTVDPTLPQNAAVSTSARSGTATGPTPSRRLRAKRPSGPSPPTRFARTDASTTITCVRAPAPSR